MNSGNNKNKIDDNKDENRKFINAFNDIDLFLGMLLVCEGFTLFACIMQIYFNGRDRMSEIAGTTTALLIMTIYHMIKRRH